MANKRFSHFYRMGRSARRQGKPLDSCKLGGDAATAWRCGWYEQDLDFYHANQGPCDGYFENKED